MVPYLLYPLIAVIALFLGSVIFFAYSKQTNKYTTLAKNLFIVATILFLITLVVCMSLHLKYRSELDDDNDDKFFINAIYFYPLLASAVLFIAAVGFFFYAKQNDRFLRPAKWTLFGVTAASLAVLFVCILIYYIRVIAVDVNYDAVNPLWLYVGAALLIAVICVIYGFFGRKSDKKSETRSVTYAAICLALSFSLSYIRLFKLPQGGAITLASLLPLMFYSQMFGIRKGIVAGVIYGILQAIQDPWILHPAQFLLDYPIAFACIGLTSIFTQKGIKGKKGIVLFGCGALLAVTMRYAAHVISGIFAFSMYAKEGYGAVAWGFVYNAFAYADMAIALTLGVLMLWNGAFLKIINQVTHSTFLAVPTETLRESGEETQA